MPTTAARRSLQLSAEWSFLRTFSTVRQPEITFPLASGNKLIKSRAGRNFSWENYSSHLEASKQAHVWVSGGRSIRVSDLFDNNKVGLLRRKVSVQMIGKLDKLDKIIEVQARLCGLSLTFFGSRGRPSEGKCRESWPLIDVDSLPAAPVILGRPLRVVRPQKRTLSRQLSPPHKAKRHRWQPRNCPPKHLLMNNPNSPKDFKQNGQISGVDTNDNRRIMPDIDTDWDHSGKSN